MKINVDKMRYKNDSLSFWFCILAIIADCCYFVNVYGNDLLTQAPRIGIDIVLNILFLLATFWCAEETKNYRKKWSYVAWALAIFQISRIFYLPTYYFDKGELILSKYVREIVYLSVSAACMIVVGISCFIKSALLTKHLKSLKSISEETVCQD